MDSTTSSSPAHPWEGYDAGACYDEVFEPSCTVRPQYADLLAELEHTDLGAVRAKAAALVDERGIAFGGPDGHPFALDPVPRILSVEEWSRLTQGLSQRVRALDAFLDDVYGDRRVVAEGVIPERAVTGRTSRRT